MRPDEEMLAFWPVRDPGRRRHVCRPSLQRPEVPSCFRLLVGPANVHAIELTPAALAAERSAQSPLMPVVSRAFA